MCRGHEGGRGVGEASWSHDTHPNSGLAVQAGGSLRGYGGMSDMNKAGLVTRWTLLLGHTDGRVHNNSITLFVLLEGGHSVVGRVRWVWQREMEEAILSQTHTVLHTFTWPDINGDLAKPLTQSLTVYYHSQDSRVWQQLFRYPSIGLYSLDYLVLAIMVSYYYCWLKKKGSATTARQVKLESSQCHSVYLSVTPHSSSDTPSKLGRTIYDLTGHSLEGSPT